MTTQFFLLLLVLSAFLASADVFVSIDCGSSSSYTDDNFIIWSGDDLYNQNGLVKTVQSSNSFSPVMDTLRVFTTRKKNCYAIPADKGTQLLVRASFFYGNYDQLSSPPTFDLQFDGNHWVTVESSSTDVVSYEAIYVVKGEVTSVCVAQTKPNQFPFISALEVRSLDSTMYNKVDSSFSLFLKTRVAYGTNLTTRYSDDPYDRIWRPVQAGSGLIEVANDAGIINTKVDDNPPQAVLLNAITTPTTSQYISFGPKFPSTQTLVYMTMYFSEVTQLDSTQKRLLKIYKNNQSFSDIITPPYGGVWEFVASNFTVSSDTTFAVMATPNSTLPPLINAMEVFFISDPLTDGTNGDDVNGLVALQNEFAVLQDWSSDPCLPSPYSWDWINCTNDATPRVTALYLSSFGLSGSLPDFSSLTALETIDLHNNSIYGTIPDFLGTLPNLKELNLAGNQFSGVIPTSLSKNNKIKLVVTGNPDLCTSGKSCQTTDYPSSTDGSTGSTTTTSYGKKKSNKLPVILGSTIPSFIIFWAIVGALVIFHNKRKSAAVSAATGQNNGANQHNATSQSDVNSNVEMGAKMGEAFFNEFKANMDQQDPNNNNNN